MNEHEVSVFNRPDEYVAALTAHGGEEAYRLDVDLRRTALSFQEWVVVRTASFKALVGDWLPAAHLRWVDDAPPVVTLRGDEIPLFRQQLDIAKCAAALWEADYGSHVKRADVGVIEVNRRTATDSLRHGYSAEKVQALKAVPEALKLAVQLGELPRESNKPQAFMYAAPIRIADETYRLLMMVRRDVNSHRLYIHEVVLRRKRDPDLPFISPASASWVAKAEPGRGKEGRIRQFMRTLRETQLSPILSQVTQEPLAHFHVQIALMAHAVAFEGVNLRPEIARIVHQAAEIVAQKGLAEPALLKDSNGNLVGSVTLARLDQMTLDEQPGSVKIQLVQRILTVSRAQVVRDLQRVAEAVLHSEAERIVWRLNNGEVYASFSLTTAPHVVALEPDKVIVIDLPAPGVT